MSLWSRIANVLRGDRLSREIDDELRSHLEEAMEQGREPAEARRAFGSLLRLREASRDVRLMPWLDSLRADAVYGWRQIVKRKVTSAAAILSLALAIGACTSAFRLIDALLLRPLPVVHPERLYGLLRQGTDVDGSLRTNDNWAYPAIVKMRDAVKGQAELMSISLAFQTDLTYGSEADTEKAYLQYVSGWMFPTLGLQPTIGRLFTENDDIKPGAHPVAVLSYDYWTRRFGKDPKAVGRTFRLGDTIFQIVGVGPESFTGTETGTVTGIFVPTMMSYFAIRTDMTWTRTLAMLKPGVDVEPLRARLHATSRAFEEERLKGVTSMSRQSLDKFLDQKLILEPAAAGLSGLQQSYRPALLSLAVLVALVLLIACANVANLMTAQASSRAREMALRVSIGAGRWRLVQLVMVESAWLAFLSAAGGAWFAWWSAPFVVSMINPPDNPARLLLPMDFRVLAFGIALTLLVTFLFGLIPALRASSIKPASALKGGSDTQSRRRLMHALIAAQIAFCFVVMFVAGLFAASFERLSNRPLGFSTDRLLTLDTSSRQALSPVVWDQVAQHLRETPGVESVALCAWPLLKGWSWNGVVSINGAPPGPELAYFLNVSPGWLDTMRIPFIDGRDFRPGDFAPIGAASGVAIINQTFARQYFNGENPLGRTFAKNGGRYQVVGLVRDAPYKALREPILPVAYVPVASISANAALQPISVGTFIVRTATSNPAAMASVLRQEVSRARGEFRVSNILSQADLVRAQTVRERLLTLLGLFFAGVALTLAGIGLYGVLDYSVLQRRREIGIRMAIGARAGDIARRVTAEVFAMVLAGSLAGLAMGIASVRYIEALLYQVTSTELNILAIPVLAVVAAALLASAPPVIRAIRIDPVTILRTE